ncbi:MAG TPA: protein kinase [Pyrinomonadaceae bacterium]|jgi:serine/threonine protein kinase/sugar lactone lactonase YvrE|nr:protein kinase [Pyrinomonadaceae bacterium]
MTPERYRMIGELFHAALEVNEAQRAVFLENQCAGDEDLLREVTTLLASNQEASGFIASPALAVAAEQLAADQVDALIGQRIGRYRVLSIIGVGGMGRVYLAEDTALGRRAALKLLPEYFTHDRNQIQRFRQEARAASALNHPNILTVYEVGDLEGTEFIATEYVEGQTLRCRLGSSPFNIREALDVAAQIGDALAAAHAAGIIHRDIKPENIMLRADGYVKVLDFGLAKLTENISASVDTDVATKQVVKTSPGVVMGTVQYMSPEQARGLKVDGRTDVWSLGVIIYEMITSRRPFEGPTQSDTTVAILQREPAQLARYIPEVPAELERIVTKALAKQVDMRYQDAKDMAIDLRRLRHRLDVDAEIERSLPRSSTNRQPSDEIYLGPQSLRETDAQPPAKVSAAGTSHTTSSVEYIISEIKRHQGRAVLVGVTLLIVLAGVGYGLYQLTNRQAPPVSAFQTIRMTRLTATGKVYDAAISPDGKHVVYSEVDNQQGSLWVRQVATGSSVQIIPPAAANYAYLTFSPGGDYIYFVKDIPSESSWSLYRIPALGGAATKVIGQVDTAVTFSPDGQRMAFVRASPQRGEYSLVVVNVDGSGEKILNTRRQPEFFVFDGIVRLSWSHDGKTIACPSGSADADGLYFNVVGVHVEDGTTTLLTSKRWGRVSQVEWGANDSDLIMVANEEEASYPQLWRVSSQTGEVHRVTNDLSRYNDLSLTNNASSLVTVQSNRASNIWVAPDGDARRAKQITTGTSDSSLGLSWTPDGKIVFHSDASGKPEIWIMNADGTDRRQLTHDGYNYRPVVAATGRYIVFHRFRGGKTNVWRMDLDGGNQLQLTNGKRNFFPDISSDGQWVVYSSPDSGEIRLWKVSIDGGEPTQLSPLNAHLPVISPDDKQIAASYQDEKADPIQGVMILPFNGGQPTKRLNIALDAINGFALHWSPDGRSLLYFDANLSNIWSIPIAGGPATQLTNFQGEPLFNFAWSHDGKWLALARGRVTNDVVLINDLK